MDTTMITRWLIILSIYWRAHAQTMPVIDVIVAKDGSGNYTTINDAILAAPDNNPRRYGIKIKAGNYTEYIRVPPNKKNLAFVGDGSAIISGNKRGREGIKTYDTATVGIKGDGFLAIGITFENTAGPNGQQAVAFRSDVQSAFYQCKFIGYQDTLYIYYATQFYRDCAIYGTIYFIFGKAAAVFQNCKIYLRLPSTGQYNTVTAQGLDNPTDKGGIVLQNCTITAAKDLRLNGSSIKSYLGRPWKIFSTTVVMQTFIDEVTNPKGWIEWEGNTTSIDNIYFAECQNRGPGAATEGRVKCTTLKMINRTEAARFSVGTFLEGEKWIPPEVPFYPNLI